MKKIFVFMMLGSINWSFAQEIDLKRSSIKFSVTNLGLEVKGQFRLFKSKMTFDPDQLDQSHFKVTISVKSINTNNRMRDEHLQKEAFFDAAAYPKIIFTSQKITKQDDHFVVIGILQMKGISRQVSIPFTYRALTFTGKFTLDRNDYQIGGSGFLNPIGDNVKIAITCVLKMNH